MKVSELARRAGIAPSAVRFYESAGVLAPPRRSLNGYRDYDEEDLCRLRLVVSLRGLGLDLTESGRLAEMCSAGNCDEMSISLSDRLTERRNEIAAARAELDHLDAELTRLQTLIGEGGSVGTLCIEKGATDGDVLRLSVRH